jgi:hypothetical protein
LATFIFRTAGITMSRLDPIKVNVACQSCALDKCEPRLNHDTPGNVPRKMVGRSCSEVG